MKRYYTVKEASKILGTSTNTIYKYVNQGKLKSRRIGRGRFKIPFSELQPFIKQEDPIEEEFAATQAPKIKQQVKVQKTSEIKDGDFINFDKGDRVIFRVFKGLFFAGLGIIYLSTKTRIFPEVEIIGVDLSRVLNLALPFILLIGGYAALTGSTKDDKFKELSVWFHSFAFAILVYLAFASFTSGSLGLFVFVVSFLAIVLLRLVEVIRGGSIGACLYREFYRFILAIALVSGVVVIFYPSILPFSYLQTALAFSKGASLLIWYAILVPLLIYLMSRKGEESDASFPLTLLLGILFMYFSVGFTFKSSWDLSYLSFITGVFALFISFWRKFAYKINPQKIHYLLVSFVWTASVVLFGFFAIDDYQNKLRKDNQRSAGIHLEEGVSKLNNFFDEQAAAMIFVAGDESFISYFEEKDTDEIVEGAKLVYSKTENAKRVQVYDEAGIIVGTYPRDEVSFGRDLSSRLYFQQTKDTYRGYISDVTKDLSGNFVVVHTEPIFKNNQFIGMMAIELDLQGVYRDFQEEVGTRFTVHALDRASESIYVFDTDLTKIGQLADLSSFVSSNTTQGALVNSSYLKKTGWTIYIETPLTPIFERTSSINVAISVALLVNAALSLWVGLMLAQGTGGLKLSPGVKLPFSTGQRIKPSTY